jgi:hypothetical protein
MNKDAQHVLGRRVQGEDPPVPEPSGLEGPLVDTRRDYRSAAIGPEMAVTRKSEFQGDPYLKPYRISPVFEVCPVGGSGAQFTAVTGEGNGRYQAPIDFEAHAIFVDNLSNQFLYFPTANKWVPPYSVGVVIPVTRGVSTLDVKFIAPANFALPPVIALQFVSLQAYEGWLAPSSGVDISQVATGIDTDTNVDQWGGGLITSTPYLQADALNVSTSSLVPVGVFPDIFNGATWDRQRTMSPVGDGLGVILASQPSSTPLAATANNAVATLTIAAVAGQQHRVTFLDLAYAGGIPAAVTLATLSDGTTTYTFPQAAANASQNETSFPAGGVKFAVNTNTVVTLPASGTAGTIGYINVAKLTA